ncbi:MAG: hypothetical protein ACRD4I_18285, partial [Candidatus Angelobacter sp.]
MFSNGITRKDFLAATFAAGIGSASAWGQTSAPQSPSSDSPQKHAAGAFSVLTFGATGDGRT